MLEAEDRIDGAAFDKKLINELGPFPEEKQLEVRDSFWCFLSERGIKTGFSW